MQRKARSQTHTRLLKTCVDIFMKSTMEYTPESRAAVLKRRTLKATARHVSERTGKTNIRLEVKWSDCAPGEIPEPPANARSKINAGRWASRRGADF